VTLNPAAVFTVLSVIRSSSGSSSNLSTSGDAGA